MKRSREGSYTPRPVKSICTNGGGWLRGPMLGKGGFGSVHAALFSNPRPRFRGFPPVVAVKSAFASCSAELTMERMLLGHLGLSPFLIKCFGEDVTVSDKAGRLVLNVFLEYASGGSLADLIKNTQGLGLLESQVRRHTRSILGGLMFIHQKGFVHCDIKPANILLVPDHDGVFMAKVADLGLAKSTKLQSRKGLVRGTSLYLPPEAVMEKIQDQGSDIWALGYVVLEMLTGQHPWGKSLPVEEVWLRIATQAPVLPTWISKEAKDFVLKCFTRNPKDRPSAEELLNHPFVCDSVIEDGQFRKPENLLWSSSESDVEDSNFIPLMESSCEEEEEEEEEESVGFATERLIMPVALMGAT